jgi:hypothetical protein
LLRFAVRTALVTGGASGIGAAVARRLATERAGVVVADSHDVAEQKLAADIDGDAATLAVTRRCRRWSTVGAERSSTSPARRAGRHGRWRPLRRQGRSRPLSGQPRPERDRAGAAGGAIQRAGCGLVGVDVAAAKLVAFGVSAFLAGLGGALIGYSRGQLSATWFGVSVSLTLLAFAYLGGTTSIGGALVAGTLAPLGIGYVVLDGAADLGEDYPLVSGMLPVATAVLDPAGVAGSVRAAWRP